MIKKYEATVFYIVVELKVSLFNIGAFPVLNMHESGFTAFALQEFFSWDITGISISAEYPMGSTFCKQSRAFCIVLK